MEVKIQWEIRAKKHTRTPDASNVSSSCREAPGGGKSKKVLVDEKYLARKGTCFSSVWE